MHNIASTNALTGCLGFKMLFVRLDELGSDVAVQHLLFGWMSYVAGDRKEPWISASSGAGEDTIAVIEKMLEQSVVTVHINLFILHAVLKNNQCVV